MVTKKVREERKKNPELIPKFIPHRHPDFNEEVAARICELVSTHTCGIKKLCAQYPDLPALDTIYAWRHRYESFSDQFLKAKKVQAELLAEECLDISDDSALDFIETDTGKVKCNNEYVNRSRLRIDTRKWIASKLQPKLYGDKVELEKTLEVNSVLATEVAALRAELALKNKKDY